jgi:hypothetical protein
MTGGDNTARPRRLISFFCEYHWMEKGVWVFAYCNNETLGRLWRGFANYILVSEKNKRFFSLVAFSVWVVANCRYVEMSPILLRPLWTVNADSCCVFEQCDQSGRYFANKNLKDYLFLKKNVILRRFIYQTLTSYGLNVNFLIKRIKFQIILSTSLQRVSE